MTEKVGDFLLKHGPWTLLAFGVVAFQMFEVRPWMASMQAEHREIRAEDAEQDLKIQNVMGQVLMAIERSNYLERRNCINTARTATDREACAKDRE